jgi:hypothetical protein
MRACVHSVYMNNISVEMRDYQKRCVERFLPKDWAFTQVHRDIDHHNATSHAEVLADCVRYCPSDVIVFLDIDAIPLTVDAFEFLYEKASKGTLVGPAQRSLHLQNDRHIFIAMSAAAFSRQKYAEYGRPSFGTTQYGDIAESLTYTWEARGAPIHLMRPTHVEVPLWPYEVDGEKIYGHGTTFGGMFYHEFESSGYTGKATEHKTRFLNKCREVLGE